MTSRKQRNAPERWRQSSSPFVFGRIVSDARLVLVLRGARSICPFSLKVEMIEKEKAKVAAKGAEMTVGAATDLHHDVVLVHRHGGTTIGR